MRVLLDHCVPKSLARYITGHSVQTCRRAGLDGLADGDFLREMDGRFDALITVDRGLRFQQNTEALSFCIVVLHARSNSLEHLAPLVPQILAVLASAMPAQVHVIDGKLSRGP